ncbi:MAG TPA: hypothetical protein VGR18_05620 [Rubrobacter sp.]|nr:hypothetical protein [Rubrobacter sp.]
MSTTRFLEVRDARLVGAVVAGLVISLTLTLCVARTALAVTDYDGDGATAGDCKPFDAAVAPGRPDEPDLALEDTNCDGIDGDERGRSLSRPRAATLRRGPKPTPCVP